MMVATIVIHIINWHKPIDKKSVDEKRDEQSIDIWKGHHIHILVQTTFKYKGYYGIQKL